MTNDRLDRFTKLLKEIFELDKSDLDKKMNLTPNKEQEAFAEEIGMPVRTLMIHLQHPFFYERKI